MSKRSALVLVGVLVLGVGSSARGQLSHGDIVYSRDDAGSGKYNVVYKLAGGTGDPIVVSQPTVRGSGADFGSIIGGMVVDADYNILLTGFDADAVFKIDPVTGNRSILSGPGVGTGPAMDGANDIATSVYVDRIFVSAGTAHSIIEVDRFTGNRTLVTGPGRGTGPVLDHPAGLARSLTGDFYAFDADTEAVFFVDGSTGDRRIVSGAGAGSGPEFNGGGFGITFLADGSLAVTDHGRRVFRVDPVTGARSFLTGMGVGDGPSPNSMEYLSLNGEGWLLATSATEGVILVDPATGDRSWVTGGPDAWRTGGVFREAVQVNPEPSSVAVLGVAAGVGMLARRGRRDRGRAADQLR